MFASFSYTHLYRSILRFNRAQLMNSIDVRTSVIQSSLSYVFFLFEYIIFFVSFLRMCFYYHLNDLRSTYRTDCSISIYILNFFFLLKREGFFSFFSIFLVRLIDFFKFFLRKRAAKSLATA